MHCIIEVYIIVLISTSLDQVEDDKKEKSKRCNQYLKFTHLLVLATLIYLLSCGRCIIDLGKMSEKKIIPVVKAEEEEAAEEEELVDPQTQLRESCSQKPDAQNHWAKYQECNNRVNSRSQTAETCEEELIDYLHVLDHCVTKDLFKRLK